MNTPRTHFVVRLPVPAAVAFAWHARPLAFDRLVPPFDPVRLLEAHGTIHEGDWKLLALPPFGMRWLARHEAYEPPVRFRDVQERGPFARCVHDHRFVPLSADECELHDELDWRLSLEPLSYWFAGKLVRNKLRRAFAWRQHVLLHDLALHQRVQAHELRFAMPVPQGNATLQRAMQVVRAIADTGGHSVVRPDQLCSAHVRWESPMRVSVQRSSGTVEFELGTLVLEAKDLRTSIYWTDVHELTEALLLAVAGHLPAGTWSLRRDRSTLQSDDSPIPALQIADRAIPSRWTSLIDLRQRLRGEVAAADTGMR